MKSLKYSLFLSVASACMFSSSLVAAATVQQLPAPALVNPLAAPAAAVDNGKKQKPSPEEIEKLKAAKKLSKQSQLPVGNVEEPMMPNLFEPAAASGQVTPPVAPQLPVLAPVTAPQAQVGAPVANLSAPAPLLAPVTAPVTTLLVPGQHDASALVPAPQLQVPAPVANLSSPAPALTLDASHAGQQLQVSAPLQVPAQLSAPAIVAPQLQVGAPMLAPVTPLLVPGQHDASALVPAPQLQVPAPVANLSSPAPALTLDASHAGQQLQVLAPMAPSEAEKNKAAEAQAVKEVVDGVPTKRAEDLVAALVANKMATNGSDAPTVLPTVENVPAAVNPAVVPAEVIPAPVLAPVKKAKPTLTPEQALALSSAKEAQAAGRTLTQEETDALLAVEALKAEKARLRAEAAANPANVPVAPVAKVKKTKSGSLSAESIAALNAAKLAKAQNAPLTQEQTDALVKAQAEIASKQKSPVIAPAEGELLPLAAPAAEETLLPVDLFAEPTAVTPPPPPLPAAIVAAPVPLSGGLVIDAKLAMNGKGEVNVDLTTSLNQPNTANPLTVEKPAVGVTDAGKKEDKPAETKKDEVPSSDVNKTKEDAAAGKKVEDKPAETKKDEVPSSDVNKTKEDAAAGKKVEDKPAAEVVAKKDDAAGKVEAPKAAEVSAN